MKDSEIPRRLIFNPITGEHYSIFYKWVSMDGKSNERILADIKDELEKKLTNKQDVEDLLNQAILIAERESNSTHQTNLLIKLRAHLKYLDKWNRNNSNKVNKEILYHSTDEAIFTIKGFLDKTSRI